jgi:hypothetical protein
MTKTGNVSLKSALAVAEQTSCETPAIIQVRQVSATEFGVFFPNHPKFKPVGVLVGAFQNGRPCAA